MDCIPGQRTKTPHAAGHLSTCAATTEPMRSRARARQPEEPPQWEARTRQPESSPCSPLERSPRGGDDPAQPKLIKESKQAVFGKRSSGGPLWGGVGTTLPHSPWAVCLCQATSLRSLCLLICKMGITAKLPCTLGERRHAEHRTAGPLRAFRTCQCPFLAPGAREHENACDGRRWGWESQAGPAHRYLLTGH